MYTYFGLSTLGPRLKPYLWWKRYLTQLQLGQFVFFGLYAVVFFFKQTGYPAIFLLIAMTQPLFFFCLFFNFYQKTYSSKNINSNNKSSTNNNQQLQLQQQNK